MKHWIYAAALLGTTLPASAMDFTDGVSTAVPVKNGQAPQIDGSLADWDVSAAEPAWIAPATADRFSAEWALNYDADALYIGATVRLPGRPLQNPNNPQDGFWWGDILQVRLAADPNEPYPLTRGSASTRIAHISIWKNTETGQDFLHLGYGAGINKGSAVNPPGSKIVIKTSEHFYTVEARVPWSALNVPGGRNPFAPGQKMPAIFETLWTGGDSARVAMNYRRNPGVFAFQNPDSWGQVEFAAQGFAAPRRPPLDKLIQKLQSEAGKNDAPPVGVPFVIDVPRAAKVSVNILGPKGEVVRELMGGQAQPQGKLTLHWDGKDSWGHTMPVGDYRWGAYFSGGLKAQFYGAVGKSGAPFHDTPEGKGGWGADHSNPIDCAADATGLYFLWPVAEAGRAIVKTDFNGKVLWRKTPFVGGGFGPFYTFATNGETLFLVLGDKNLRLVRLQAATGQLMTWGEGGPAELPIGEFKLADVPAESSPLAVRGDDHTPLQPESVGLAANAREVFIALYGQNKILVADPGTGKVTRELLCEGPRGLTLAPSGDLYAVSYLPGKKAHIVRFAAAAGPPQPIVTSALAAPWDVALDGAGRIYVSDLGNAQQVKVFDAAGKLLERRGTPGGRKWMGRYDGAAFLHPAGIATDPRGGLLVAESSIPKVFSRFNAADGKLLGRWFGAPVYWTSTWPTADDPANVFYPLNGGIGRARIRKEGETGMPEAYIAPVEAGYPQSSDFSDRMPQPEIVRTTNGRQFLVSDGNPHTIGFLHNDEFRPVAHFRVVNNWHKESTAKKNYVEVWRDKNGDGLVQPDELTVLETIAGQPLVPVAELTSSMHMEPNGDLYFMTQANRVLKIPATGFAKDGAPQWNTAAASYIIPTVLPSSNDNMSTTWRHGLLGTRLDKSGNAYVVFNTSVEGKGGPFDFATPELAAKAKEGMGHTATFNVTKFAKFDSKGNLLWMAGRKATAAARTGEMYHFWNMAGIVGDRYIAGASEWGQIYFYTHDGFFVDALMNNPGLTPLPGPYTFGGETSGGRVQYFPARDELWAYVNGMAYKVAGIKKGAVIGESRSAGSVKLDRVYDTAGATEKAAPLQLVPLAGDPLTDANAWAAAPVGVLRRNDAELAHAQLGYDANYVYAKIRVTDDSPLQNSADTVATAFKGGDTAGFVLGAAGQRSAPQAGDVRFMAAQIGGRPRLIAMKAITAGAKKPESYITPAAGVARFEFVGEVPGGKVVLTPDATGYTATFAVPRSFIELEVKPGAALAGDIEVRLSGAGPRGLQAVSRNYLFTPMRPETTMTDDVPTEGRLYPQYWGSVEVK